MLMGYILLAIAVRIPPVYNFLANRKKVGEGPEKLESGSFE
jgi:hypothetical protein